MFWYLKKELWAERDVIIFGNADLSQYNGGIRHFNGLTLDQIHQLQQNKLICPWGRQNNSPTAQEIWEFMEKYDGYTAIGYAVSPQREDCRVTIEGVVKTSPIVNPDELVYFQRLFVSPDELIINYTRVWYD